MIGGELRSRLLWSLWEMLEFNAAAFYEATFELTALLSWIRAQQDDKDSIFYKGKRLDDSDRHIFIAPRFKKIHEHLVTLGAQITLLAVRDAEESINDTEADWERVKDDISDINKTLKRELTTVTLLALEKKAQSYFCPTGPLFGSEVQHKFNTTSFEIDEAAKCLALGRPTACVFHLMRVMEIAVRAVARCLGVRTLCGPQKGIGDLCLGRFGRVLRRNGRLWPRGHWERARRLRLFMHH
jgi:hypothetical protein